MSSDKGRVGGQEGGRVREVGGWLRGVGGFRGEEGREEARNKSMCMVEEVTEKRHSRREDENKKRVRLRNQRHVNHAARTQQSQLTSILLSVLGSSHRFTTFHVLMARNGTLITSILPRISG